MDRVLLLVPTSTYKSADFLEAAGRLGADVVVGSERRQALEGESPDGTLTLRFDDTVEDVRRIVALHDRRPIGAVVGTDDETTVLASFAAEALGLRHNPPDAVRATRDKHAMRCRLASAGLRGPRFRLARADESPEALAASVDYPCVVKPLSMSASQGVIRADDPGQLVAAFRRIVAMLDDRTARRVGGRHDALLVEDYLEGDELALEGLLDDGQLHLLALFDKPDPLEGPTFQETLYITPSRRPAIEQDAIVGEVAAGCSALGLREGPVHAELRYGAQGPVLLEIAPRTIGGLCSRTLRFGAGVSLEELVLRHALGAGPTTLGRESQAAGVMMIPIPRAGILRGVEGLDRARSVPGVCELTLTMHRGARLVPLPEGNRYLGFIFARAESPQGVESALRAAHDALELAIDSSDEDAAPQKPGLEEG